MSAFRKAKEQQVHIGLPHSLNAEEAVIGALLFNGNDTYTEIGELLRPEHFYNDFCRSVYDKAADLVISGQTPDVVILAATLEAASGFSQEEIYNRLTDIAMRYPSKNDNVLAWAKLIVEKYSARQVDEAGQAMREMAFAQNMSMEERLAAANQLLSEAIAANTGDTIIQTTQMVASTLEMIERNLQKGDGITGVPTSFAPLDELTSGFQPGELIIIAARPAMGKTSFALTIANALACNPDKALRQSVAMFSLEMGRQQIGMRWLALQKDVLLKNMKSGRVTPEEYARLQDALLESPEVPFYMDESAPLTMEKIAAKARRLKRENNLKLLMVDYLQLISGNPRLAGNREQQIAEISRGLKQLSRELEIPVVALSQLSRSLEQRADRRPIMSDLRESGAIEQDADLILFLYRDEVYNPNTADKDIAEVIIGKYRSGALDTIKLGFHGPTTRFYHGKKPIYVPPVQSVHGYREVATSPF